MLRDPLAFLWDVQDSGRAVLELTAGKSYEDYLSDRTLRWATERQLGIVGGALNQLSRIAPDVAERIPRLAQVVSLRNVIVHGYGRLDHSEIWRIIGDDLPRLLEIVELRIAELEQS